MPSGYARIPTSSISITTFRPVPSENSIRLGIALFWRRYWVQTDLADARGISEYATYLGVITQRTGADPSGPPPATRAPPPWRGACS